MKEPVPTPVLGLAAVSPSKACLLFFSFLVALQSLFPCALVRHSRQGKSLGAISLLPLKHDADPVLLSPLIHDAAAVLLFPPVHGVVLPALQEDTRAYQHTITAAVKEMTIAAGSQTVYSKGHTPLGR